MTAHFFAIDRDESAYLTDAQREIVHRKREALGAEKVRITLKSSSDLSGWERLATMHWHSGPVRMQQTILPSGHLGPVSGSLRRWGAR